jgi:hypothetical protein
MWGLVEIGSVPDAGKVVTSSVESTCLVQQRLWTLTYELRLPRPDVALWPLATNFSVGPDVSFRREAEVGRPAEFAASVENDPSRKRRVHRTIRDNHVYH